MWQSYELPTTATINDKEYKIRTDYRVVLDIFKVFNDPNLTEREKIECALEIFYPQIREITDINEAVELMMLFLNGNEKQTGNGKKLMDWEQDLPIIISPVNRILGAEVRSLEYLHWWSFLSAYMEIGECTFSTFVSIRDKKSKGKKLEKYEQEIYRNNQSKIDLKQQIDDTTQSIIDEIMGR